MENVVLRADCARCAALCCVSLAFDKSDLFAIDKAARRPCPHLAACGGCTIHAERAEQGFRGCVEFDCLGAGQRVTQDLFHGRDWREEPSLLEPMSRMFSILLRSHEHLSLLREAERLDLSAGDRGKLDTLRSAIERADALEEVDALAPQLNDFLTSLRPYVDGAKARREPAGALR